MSERRGGHQRASSKWDELPEGLPPPEPEPVVPELPRRQKDGRYQPEISELDYLNPVIRTEVLLVAWAACLLLKTQKLTKFSACSTMTGIHGEGPQSGAGGHVRSLKSGCAARSLPATR